MPVIGCLVIRMPQAGRNGLPPHHAIRLRQRRERPAGAHLEVDAIRGLSQRRDPGGKADRSAQMGDPVIRAGRLGRGKRFARPVGDDRNARG